MARRMAKQWLARGFHTWAEGYWEQQERARAMRRAMSKLQKPGLLAAFSWWQDDWQAFAREAEINALTEAWESEEFGRAHV